MADLFASDVKTASLTVEIKSLHVGTKQMTLSVFRQIQEEDLLDKDFKLRGKPWGLVNYWWDKCPQWNSTYIHVLWQKDNELRRFRRSNIVEYLKTGEPGGHQLGAIQSYFIGDSHSKLRDIVGFLEGTYSLNIKGEIIKPKQEYEKNGVFELPKEDADEWVKKRNAEKKIKYEKSIEVFKQCEDKRPELEKIFKAKELLANTYLDNWRKSYAELSSLPQLYIAA